MSLSEAPDLEVRSASAAATGTEGEAPDLAALHEVLLGMLEEIDALCRRHGLRYSLYCGTLLGAVRDGDLIPWDDDADLMMPMEDCRRFLRIAQKELKGCTVQDLANTPAHPWLWTRVFRDGTTYLRRDWRKLPVHHGIAVDIYPMIGSAKTWNGLRLQRTVLDAAKALRHIDYWRTTGWPQDRRQRTAGRILGLIPGPLRRGLSRLLLRMAAPPARRMEKCCTLDGAVFFPKFDSADWEEYTEVTLAGRRFFAPAQYDSLLRVMYGEYRIPVPPEKWAGGHGDRYGGLIIDTRRDYKDYLGEAEETAGEGQ